MRALLGLKCLGWHRMIMHCPLLIIASIIILSPMLVTVKYVSDRETSNIMYTLLQLPTKRNIKVICDVVM